MAKKGKLNGKECVICGAALSGRQQLYDKPECKHIAFERKQSGEQKQTVDEPIETVSEPLGTDSEPHSEVVSAELVQTKNELIKISAQLEAVQVVITQSTQERDRAIVERDQALGKVETLQRENGVLAGKLETIQASSPEKGAALSRLVELENEKGQLQGKLSTLEAAQLAQQSAAPTSAEPSPFPTRTLFIALLVIIGLIILASVIFAFWQSGRYLG